MPRQRRKGMEPKVPIISAETIRRVKDEVPISSVLDWLGVRTSGVNKAFCPICHDRDSKHPGMVYDDARGTWHCFVHNDGGDSIDLVQQAKSLTFAQAVEAIANRFGIPMTYDTDGTSEIVMAQRAEAIAIHKELQEIFVKQRVSPKFSNFVRQRNLTQDAIDAFGIGMSDSAWAEAAVKRLQARHSDEAIIRAGVCYRQRGYDGDRLVLRWTDRVMFPIRNASGTIVAFGGRDVTGEAQGKYVNSPETPIFHKGTILYGYDRARRAIAKSRTAIVCEGYMDTIALQTHGFDNAVGAMGTAVTERDLKTLDKDADKIVIALDADKAGRSAAARVLDRIPRGMTASVSVMTMSLDKAKDADEWLNQRRLPADGIRSLIDDATPLYEFCLHDAVDDFVQVLQSKSATDSERVQASKLAMSAANRLAKEHASGVSMDELTVAARWLVKAIGSTMQPEAIASKWIRDSAASTRRTLPRQPSPASAQTASDGTDAMTRDESVTSPTDIGMLRLIWRAYDAPEAIGNVLSMLMDAGYSDEVASIVTGNGTDSVLLAKELGAIQHDALIAILTPQERELLDTAQATCNGMHTGYADDLALCKSIVRARLVAETQGTDGNDYAAVIRGRQRLAKLDSLK